MSTPNTFRIVTTLRQNYESGISRPIDWRREQLAQLRAMLEQREQAFLDALKTDLGKHPVESYVSEIGFLLGEIRYADAHLEEWTQPEEVETSRLLQPGSSYIIREPLGVALIIGPWNYPVQLSLGPLIAAISAGNCAVIKPSEHAPATSAVIAALIPEYLDTNCIAVVEGGVDETTALLAERFDKIFFTGNSSVGKIVMKAAAEHLTPVTLELGGKSPCIVDREVDIAVAAKRITNGKFLNAGQTCVAPDYVLVHKDREDELLAGLTESIRGFYGESPRQSPDYGRIVNAQHHGRLTALLNDGEIVTGGDFDKDSLYIAPTVIKNIPPDAPAMQTELFGPILPVLTVNDIDEAITFVNAREKPLALYLFSTNPESQERVKASTSCGGMCINEVVLHLSAPDLPFGGVGQSGFGKYHGWFGFQAFSNTKAVLDHSGFRDRLRFPPYDIEKLRVLRRLY